MSPHKLQQWLGVAAAVFLLLCLVSTGLLILGAAVGLMRSYYWLNGG